MCSVIRSLRQAMNACFECLRSTRNTGYDGYDLRSIRCSCVRFSSFQRQAMLWEQLRMAQSRDTMKSRIVRIVGEDAERVICIAIIWYYMLLLLCLPFPRFPVSPFPPFPAYFHSAHAHGRSLYGHGLCRSVIFSFHLATKCDEDLAGEKAQIQSHCQLQVTVSHCESQAMKRIQLETELVWGPSRKVGRLALN